MMGAVIATSILIRAYRTQDTKSIYIWRLCVCFALIMDVCRIAIGVHRPMDIVAGTIVWCVVAYLCTHPAIVRLLQIYIYDWCISLEEKVMKLLQS
jgi:membrane-associated phospholipid phosphatase